MTSAAPVKRNFSGRRMLEHNFHLPACNNEASFKMFQRGRHVAQHWLLCCGNDIPLVLHATTLDLLLVLDHRGFVAQALIQIALLSHWQLFLLLRFACATVVQLMLPATLISKYPSGCGHWFCLYSNRPITKENDLPTPTQHVKLGAHLFPTTSYSLLCYC